MTAESPVLSRAEEIRFQLYEVLRLEEMADWTAFTGQDRQVWDAALETAERLAETQFANHNRAADLEEPRLEAGRVVTRPEVKPGLDAFAEAGFLAAHHPESRGGLGLPWTVAQACLAFFQAANIATVAYPFLTIAAANLLAKFASPEQQERFMAPMLSGRFFGTMALSEPQAGSGLADIRTRATPETDGSYRIEGTKQWISGGAHELSENIVHLVLARIDGAPAGVKGISLFIVPRYWVEADGSLGADNNVALVSLLHKMGYRGTTSTILNFGEAGPCRGLLVGEPHKGLAYMFQMMNEARIGVGLGAAMLADAGYRYSRAYAGERTQGRPLGDKDPSRPPVAIIDHPDVRRMVLAQKAYAEGAVSLCLYCARLVDEAAHSANAEAAAEAEDLLGLLTPIAKAWPSDYGLRANDHAIQILGGYGYTRDYPVEQYYRDARLNPIHEGTNGIQAIDLMGRKLAMNDGSAFALMADRLRADIAGAKDILPDACDALGAAFDRLSASASQAIGAVKDGRGPTLLANASAFAETMGHVVIAWMLIRQAVAADRAAAKGRLDRQAALGKAAAARWFCRTELPRVLPQLDLVDGCDTLLSETDPAWL